MDSKLTLLVFDKEKNVCAVWTKMSVMILRRVKHSSSHANTADLCQVFDKGKNVCVVWTKMSVMNLRRVKHSSSHANTADQYYM
jgi:hypothetical protein